MSNDDAKNIRTVIRIMGAALIISLCLIGWLSYVLTLRTVGAVDGTAEAADLPAGLNQMLGGLVTIAGGLATGIGVLLARTSTAPSTQNNVVNTPPPIEQPVEVGSPPGVTVGAVTDPPPSPNDYVGDAD